MRTIGDHAVVVGGSMAGLVAARVLSEAYERVTVVDRDQLADEAGPRRGVPQGRHVHALLPAGRSVLEELFPAFGEEMIASGAATADALGQFRWHLGGHRFRQAAAGVEGILSTRPMLEGAVRWRVRGLGNVEIVDRCDVVGLVTRDGDVTGVRLLRRADGSAEEVVAADLVVDCSGRTSRTPARLVELGFRAPDEEGTRLGLGYASRTYRLPPGALGRDKAVLIAPEVAGPLRGGALFAIEHGRWLVTLAGLLGDHPPTDGEGFEAFAATLAAPDIADALSVGVAIDEPAVFKYPGSVRRRYERLRAFPGRLLVMGDAVCSFNPIYGQGMSVAALEARALGAMLERGAPPVPQRFFKEISKIVDTAWDLALGADLSYPQIEGRRTAGMKMLNRYVERLQRAAERDATVGVAFVRVTGLEDPPQRLLAPSVAWRALRGGRRPGTPVDGYVPYGGGIHTPAGAGGRVDP